jgi:cysteine desulfurase
MIYLDHAATTGMEAEAVSAMLPFLSENYGNPSAVYQIAAKSRAAVAKARKQAASVIGADPSEIYFTSGGTESDNWAITAAFEAAGGHGHIITTAVEHPAVLRVCEYLERERGAKVTYLPVDRDGFVQPKAVVRAIRPDTVLVSVMTANNEVGTIEPVYEIASLLRDREILFHTDAVQAFGHVPLSVKDAGIDLLSASGHKFGGPKGTGILYIRRGVRIGSFLRGGAQERNRRAGTENVAGIVGLGAAAQIAKDHLEERGQYVRALRNRFAARILAEIPYCHLNSPRENSLPGTVNVTIDYVSAESLLIMLDMQGICASGGSACSSGSLNPSHVLLAMGRSPEEAKSTIRFTLGFDNTEKDTDMAVEALSGIVRRLRAMSPKYEQRVSGDHQNG